MSLGNMIRKLRKEKDITQEELAEALGVTSKAVSQWECERTCPDISQIPAICGFFGVTADELLEIDSRKKEARRKEILEKGQKLIRSGYKEEAWDFLCKAMKEFPNDYEMMCNAAGTGIFIINRPNCTAERREKVREKCICLCEKVLGGCTEDWMRHAAVSLLCEYYGDKGEFEKVEKMAEKMPPLFESYNFLCIKAYRGKERKKREQWLSYDLLQFLSKQMSREHGDYSEEEIFELNEKRIKLINLLFEKGDFGFFSSGIYYSYIEQAEYFAAKKNAEKTAERLEYAAKAAVEFVDYAKAKNYVHSSLMFNGMESAGFEIGHPNSINVAGEMLERMENRIFDFIRETEGFKAVKENLTAVAGNN